MVDHCWKNLLNDFVSDVYHPSGESYLLTVLKRKRIYHLGNAQGHLIRSAHIIYIHVKISVLYIYIYI